MIVKNIPEIVRSGDFRAIDRDMGKSIGAIPVLYKGAHFLLDCGYCDRNLPDDNSFTFGLVREIYMRDCYLKFHQDWAWREIRTALDLGANRGAFSVFMANYAEKVVSVEVQPHFIKAIQHNMRINGFNNCAVECALIGNGGLYDGPVKSRVTMADLLKKYSLSSFDFVKMDIEGSEFELFNSPSWLERVNCLSMEVHPRYGDVKKILGALDRYGFSFILADQTLRRTNNTNHAEFIYAYRAKAGDR